MTRLSRILCVLCLIGGLSPARLTCRAQDVLTEPTQDTVSVSLRSIRRLTALPNGDVLATTNGGTVRYSASRDTWERTSDPATEPPPEAMVPLPPGSAGTHVVSVALLPDGGKLVAVFGEAKLYRQEGDTRTVETGNLPDGAGTEITAAVETPQGMTVVGTRRQGLFQRKKGEQEYHAVPLTQEGPFDHNAQALCRFRGALYVSTLEDGLQKRTDRGWEHFDIPTLSSNAPRQMVVFQSCLYIRHGGGKVDRFDGATWERNVFPNLPRKEVSALATDGDRLYLAQWGGWSVFDGKSFEHHLNLPQLQGLPITVLCPDGDTLRIGTQGKGLAEVDRQTGAFRRWHDERNGLSDDWITEIAAVSSPSGTRLLVGTFVGGLCERDATGRWQVVPGTEGENITGIAFAGGKLIVATRHGVTDLPPIEAQCLCPGENGLWIGTRTGIRFIRRQR